MCVDCKGNLIIEGCPTDELAKMKDYVAENERILKEWRESNEAHGEANFADDGIMYRGIIDDIERYSDKEKENEMWNEAPLRVLFLAKDQNAGGEGAWDVRGETGSLSYAFFRNLMYQLYGLVNTIPGYKEEFTFTKEDAIELYNSFPIARINAKKEAGGPRVENHILKFYIERDKEFLKRQILNIDADMIVCCGYSESIEDSGNLLLNFLKKECYNHLNLQHDDGWIYYDEKLNKVAINNWHLSARTSSEKWYDQLINAYYLFINEHPEFAEAHRKCGGE